MLFGFTEETIKSLIAYALKGKHSGGNITRKSMYRSLSGALTEFDSSEKSCLAVSHSENLGRLLGLHKVIYTNADFPDHDILDLKAFNDGQFDFCVSDQVIEHIRGNPYRAFENSYRILKADGIICHTTCLLNPIHDKTDFWRFTPDALSLICTETNFDVLHVGGWGNREAWALIHAGFRSSQIPDDLSNPITKLALTNDKRWPIVTWVIAKKRKPK